MFLLGSAINALGRRSIDLFVVTHADLDHRGGAIRVLERFAVDQLWLPEVAREDAALDLLVERAIERGTRVVWRSASRTPEVVGDLRVETLWPPQDFEPSSRNAGSLVLRIGLAGQSFLLLADVDRAIEHGLIHQDPKRLRVDYLKISHHGSGGGTPSSLLEHVGARHAFVSAPCASRRGLPHPGTLDRIRDSSTRLWWTGRDGALAVFPNRGEAEDAVLAWARARPCRK